MPGPSSAPGQMTPIISSSGSPLKSCSTKCMIYPFLFPLPPRRGQIPLVCLLYFTSSGTSTISIVCLFSAAPRYTKNARFHPCSLFSQTNQSLIYPSKLLPSWTHAPTLSLPREKLELEVFSHSFHTGPGGGTIGCLSSNHHFCSQLPPILGPFLSILRPRQHKSQFFQ